MARADALRRSVTALAPALRRMTAATLALLLAAQATAHDFWIEPASFTPLPGQPVMVRLRVGEGFSGDAVARPPTASLHRFVLVDAASRASVTLPGRAGADPAGQFRLAAEGNYVIGFHGKPNAIELAAEKFNAYLEEEGLESVLAWRAERGHLMRSAREIYSRCAKSLVQAGLAQGEGVPADHALGFALELIAERAPSLLRAGESLPVRLLHEGRPLAGALVVAYSRGEVKRKIALRSDAEGRVQLPLGRAGTWLVKAVHMRAAAPDSGVDWESLWASLTFSNGSAESAAP